MRIGQIITVVSDRKFGFIRSEHFREDVFFHFSSLQGLNPKRLRIGQDVEFEIDELLRINKQQLEATLVQEPAKPLTHTLEEETVPGFKAAHHPKARRKKPSWKRNPKAESQDENTDPPPEPQSQPNP
ncbi:MAG: cold shock domain-containing protein [Pirellula sp.]|jgi:cold shock CspA family protein|nr:cold shock domain-containing protein [Pirellula sp.]